MLEGDQNLGRAEYPFGDLRARQTPVLRRGRKVVGRDAVAEAADSCRRPAQRIGEADAEIATTGAATARIEAIFRAAFDDDGGNLTVPKRAQERNAGHAGGNRSRNAVFG